MNFKSGVYFTVGLLLVVIIGLLLSPTNMIPNPSANQGSDPQTSNSRPGPATRLTRSLKPGHRMVGGVERPISDLEARTQAEIESPQAARTDRGDDQVDRLSEYGTTPAVATDATPQVESVVEAIQQKRHPERFSLAMRSEEPFDFQKYQANKEAYLKQVVPSRVFEVAQPSAEVPRIRALSPRFQETPQGSPVLLQVQAKPGYPTTFTSMDLGMFSESQLTSVTVEANADGVASAEFVAPPGTIADVNILVGSSGTSGNAKFIVHVTRP